MFMERVKPRLKALKDDAMLDPTYVYESPYYPVDNHFTINGDGLLSVCMKVHDKRGRHKIFTYDHVTRQLKALGSIPRHKFKEDVDNSVICMNDPAFTEGVLGALTDDAQFVVILSHSKGLRVLSVFDIVNASCLLEKDCSGVDFLNCGPCGIAIDREGISRRRFKIAVLNLEMEVRVWDAKSFSESAVNLEKVLPSFGVNRYLINPRQCAIKFSPHGRFLCVQSYYGEEPKQCKCLVMDPLELEPLYAMEYPFMFPSMCSIFPAFSTCGSKFAMFVCSHTDNRIYDVDDYKLLFFEIPSRVETLKRMCRSTILKLVNNLTLDKLPLPENLIAYLQDNCTMARGSSENDDAKRCRLM